MTISGDKSNASPNFNNKPIDVEHDGALPSYPLTEPEELVVGGPKNRCLTFFRRRGLCSRRANSFHQQRSSWFGRAIKFIISALILGLVAHFVVVGVKLYQVYKTTECVTINPATVPDGVDFSIPLEKASSGVYLHDSITGGDVHIIHDSSIPKGTVQLAVKFSEPSKQDKLYDGCMATLPGKHGFGVALVSRESNVTRADIASLSLRFPSSVLAPNVRLIGRRKRLSDKKLRKLIRWWKKHHKKNVSEATE